MTSDKMPDSPNVLTGVFPLEHLSTQAFCYLHKILIINHKVNKVN